MKPQVSDIKYMNKSSPYDIKVHMFPLENYNPTVILSKFTCSLKFDILFLISYFF